jgi:hypothetical protein
MVASRQSPDQLPGMGTATAIRGSRSKVYKQLEQRILEQMKARRPASARARTRASARGEPQFHSGCHPEAGTGGLAATRSSLRDDHLRADCCFGDTKPLAALLRQKRKMVGELLDVHKMLEPPLAHRATLHASAMAIADLEEILRRQGQKLGRGELAIEEHSEFHYRIALAADNNVVLKLI